MGNPGVFLLYSYLSYLLQSWRVAVYATTSVIWLPNSASSLYSSPFKFFQISVAGTDCLSLVPVTICQPLFQRLVVLRWVL